MKLTSFELVAFDVLDKWLDHRVCHTLIPGLQVCIRRKGKIIFSKAYGFANESKNIKYTTRHLGRIASQSKMFTGCALFQLEASGKLRLTDKITDYIPQLKLHKDKRIVSITIMDVLMNRAGFVRDGLDSGYTKLGASFPDKHKLLAKVLATKLVFAPRRHTKYSNFGFGLLGMVIEAASGQSYGDYVHQFIVKKIEQPILVDPVTDKYMATGYSRLLDGANYKAIRHAPVSAFTPAAGLCGTAEAASEFLYQYLFGKKLVNKSAQRKLISIRHSIMNLKKRFYGVGLMHTLVGKKTYIGHGGQHIGFESRTQWCKGTDYIISIITNSNQEFDLISIQSSIIGLLSEIQKTFGVDAKNVCVSQTLHSIWGSSLYLAGSKKALGFSLNDWDLMLGKVELQKAKNHFVSMKVGGMGSVGEPVFFKMRGKKIVAVKFGAHNSIPEKDFKKGLHKVVF